ncbi:MAG: phenylalanine--tRNA ligase subunit beta, partial [Psychrobacter glacincola]
PQVRRDIAILIDSDISLQTLESTIRKASGALLTDLWLFDVYQGEKVPAGQRSLAFALIWQDKTQTLSDDAVKTATDKVVQALTIEHSAQLRDS